MHRNAISAIKSRIRHFSVEKVCSVLCLVAAFVFLVISLLGAWRYFFISGICMVASFMVRDKPGH